MLKLELISFARSALNTHGLQAWNFIIDARPQRRLGQCRYDRKTISLSQRALNAIGEPADVLRLCKDIILHELAHALTPGSQHNAVWRYKALQLGCINPSSICHTEDFNCKLPKKQIIEQPYALIFFDADNARVEFISYHRSPLSGISSRYLRGRKQETMKLLYNVTIESYKAYLEEPDTNLMDMLSSCMGEGLKLPLKRAAATESTPSSTKPKHKSTYTAFTKSIYKVGMEPAAFTAAYLEGKPTAAGSTIRAQLYRIQKDLG